MQVRIVRLLVEYVSADLVELGVTWLFSGEQVESVLLERCADYGRVRSIFGVILTCVGSLSYWVLILIDDRLKESLLLLTLAD